MSQGFQAHFTVAVMNDITVTPLNIPIVTLVKKKAGAPSHSLPVFGCCDSPWTCDDSL
ncbi:hypothetical protein [Bartonella sp. AP58NXGY]|uniref:hypothetical protein n=1 Tax=Bartonella sp. AP58NXGY TaxID=3243498 RepID=UPI0035D06767